MFDHNSTTPAGLDRSAPWAARAKGRGPRRGGGFARGGPQRPSGFGGLAAFTVVAAMCAGCPSLESLPAHTPVDEVVEPRTAANYLLYVPSTYSDDRRWPLVIACHGTWPYDTPPPQIREWAGFAERKGIIVAAPYLLATKGDFPPPVDKQLELQRRDEEALLAIVNQLKQRYNIAEEGVFLTGWSAAAYTILHTGLRHPDVFRALAIRQGTFDERFLADVRPERLDRWQGVKVFYGHVDFLRDQTRACIRWLRENGMYVEEQETPGSHQRQNPALPWKFFSEILKSRMWIRIRARPVDVEKPMEIRFELDALPPAARQRWFFGDGEDGTSDERSPVHVYAEPGSYEVTVNVELESGRKFSRKRWIDVGL